MHLYEHMYIIYGCVLRMEFNAQQGRIRGRQRLNNWTLMNCKVTQMLRQCRLAGWPLVVDTTVKKIRRKEIYAQYY